MSKRITLSEIKAVEIPEEALRALETIPRAHWTRKKQFEPWQDRILIEYWDVKNKHQLASDVIKRSYGACLQRHRELTKELHEQGE